MSLQKTQENLTSLPFEEYMKVCYEHAVEHKFFKYFDTPEDLIFAQTIWARRYWMTKNGAYEE